MYYDILLNDTSHISCLYTKGIIYQRNYIPKELYTKLILIISKY